MIGNRTRVKVVKNKVAPPFKNAEFDIMFGQGISREGDILDLAADNNVIIKSGAWYTYNGERIGQGRENTKQYLKDNPNVCVEVEGKVRELFNLPDDKIVGDNTDKKSAKSQKTTKSTDGEKSKDVDAEKSKDVDAEKNTDA